MFRLKRKKEATANGNPVNSKERVARFLAGNIVRSQRRVADLLSHLDKRCSSGQRKALMLSLGLCWAAYCCYILVGAIIGPSKKIQGINSNPVDTALTPRNPYKGPAPLHGPDQDNDSLVFNSQK